MAAAALNTCMCSFARFICPQKCACASLRSHVLILCERPFRHTAVDEHVPVKEQLLKEECVKMYLV